MTTNDMLATVIFILAMFGPMCVTLVCKKYEKLNYIKMQQTALVVLILNLFLILLRKQQ